MEPVRAQPRWGIVDWFAAWIGSFLAVVVCQPLVLALTGQSGVTDSDKWPLSTTALLQVPLYGVMVIAAIAITKRKGNGPVADLRLAIRWKDVPLGLAVGVALQALGNALYLPLYWFTDITADDIEENARKLSDRAHGAGVLLLLLVVVIAAPLVEEIFFRGLLLRSLERRLGTRWAIVLSSLVFAASHFEKYEFPALFLFGIGAAVLAVRTDRLGPGIMAHFAFNSVAVFFLLR